MTSLAKLSGISESLLTIKVKHHKNFSFIKLRVKDDIETDNKTTLMIIYSNDICNVVL